MNQPIDPPRETPPASAPRRPYERPRIVKGRAVEQATLLVATPGGGTPMNSNPMGGPMM
jgi:hypothetical protein